MEAYPELVLVYNASSETARCHLPAGEWAVLADGESSFRWQQPQIIADKAEITAMSAMLLGKIKR